MATRQGLDSSIVNRLGADEQALFLAVKAEFDTDIVRVWTGIDDLTINSETYTGAGELLSISNVEESTDLKSSGLSVGISGMDTTVLNLALTENYQNRFITVYLGYLMGKTNEYTKESQNFLHNGDTGFNRVASLQDKEIIWGKQSDTGSGGTGSGSNSRAATIAQNRVQE